MSMGIGGWRKVVAQDEVAIIYQYGAYNLNEPQYRNEKQIQDGIFLIQKDSLVEPEIRRKQKKLPHGKKKEIFKRLVVPVPCEDLYKGGKIQIQNCSHCWKTSIGGKDYIAWHLNDKVFSLYQETGQLPGTAGYHT